MTRLEKRNRKLAWYWSKKLDRGIRCIKIIQYNAFYNYLKTKTKPEGMSDYDWNVENYKFYKATVYDNSFISHVNKDNYHIDFISQGEGMPDDEDSLTVGFKIWKDGWSLPDGTPVYAKFLTYALYNGFDSAWETNSTIVPPEIEYDIYENVFPSLKNDIKLIISNLEENVHGFELAEAERDFKVVKTE